MASTDHNMSRCLLSDIPAHVFQAMVLYLEFPDYASLRLVSRSVCERTNPTVPYLTLSLCRSSSTEQLQHWCHAIRHFHHVTNFHIHISTGASAEVFELAMQLLSQRSNHLTELHVLAVDDGSNNHYVAFETFVPSPPVSADLETLQPIQHLIAGLTTLVIRGIAVPDLPADLEQLAEALAAADDLQLQSLTLSIEQGKWRRPPISMFDASAGRAYVWYDFTSALAQLLKTASPSLKRMVMKIPPLGYHPEHHDEVCEWLVDGKFGLQYAEALRVLDDEDIELASYASEKALAAAALVAAVAAIFNAVCQLKDLEELSLTEVPDIWKLRESMLDYNPEGENDDDDDDDDESQEPSTITAVALAAARADIGGLRITMLHGGLVWKPLTTVAEAAAVLSTLDNCGCWLLQHHPTLKQLQISTADTGWGMSWQRQQEQQRQQQQSSLDGTKSSQASDGETPALLSVSAVIRDPGVLGLIQSRPPPDTDDDSSSSYLTLMSYCTSQLGCYSSRSVSSLLCHISRCRVYLSDHQVGGLDILLRDFESLEHLQIICRSGGTRCSDALTGTTTAAARAAVKAAAAVSGLQSLDLRFRGPADHMPLDLLLPLTAAQGGPGSNLTRFVICGGFTAAGADAAHGSAGNGTGWLHALNLLEGLQQLSIEYTDFGQPDSISLYPLAACDLPAKLKMFQASRLDISGDPAGPDADSSVHSLINARSMAAPQLSKLVLQDCQLSSPSILASSQLQQLTVVDSSWSGGWAAAAAAWPHVIELVWASVVKDGQYDGSDGAVAGATQDEDSSSSMMSKAAGFIVAQLAADSATAQEMFTIIPTALQHLKSMTMHQLPWLHPQILSAAVVLCLMQRLKMIQHLHLKARPGPHIQDGGFKSGVLDHDVLVAEVHKRLASSNINSSTQFNLDNRPMVLQQWMQQQMPWASIHLF